jgi:excisionase family DNA binding protein
MTQLPANEGDEGKPQLLTSNQVASALGVGVAVVQEWARDGKIQCITLPSGRRRFKREVVDAILAGESAA